MEQSVDTKSVNQACPVCTGDASQPVLTLDTIAKYEIVVCKSCGLAFAIPRPTPAELDAFYTSDYFMRSRQFITGYADYRALGELNARNMWKELNSFTSLKSVHSKKLLDVGCATGGFLAEAQTDGWQCLGIELSEDAASVAQQENGVQVLHGDIHHSQLDTLSFGLITMWHVLEHMIDPIFALQRTRELLEPSGLLFIELPNWNSVGRLVRKEHWSQLKPPEHINFFTPVSLRYAVEKAGFEVVASISHYECSKTRMALRSPVSSMKALAKLAVAKLGHGGYVRLLAKRK